MANSNTTYHEGYLSFLADVNNLDIEGLKKALTTNMGSLSVCENKVIFGLEAEHLLNLDARITELMNKYPMRFWLIGPFYTRREKIRRALIEAKANSVVASHILVHLSK